MSLDKNTKFVFFGGLGFIGENLTNYLLNKGFKNIVLFERNIDNNSSKYERYKYLLEKISSINFQSDFDEFSKTEKELKDADVIINFIYSKGNYSSDLDRKILEFCSRCNKNALLIYMGSRVQYDNKTKVIDENSELSYNNDYSKTKNSIEDLYHFYERKEGLNIIYIKGSNVYGYSSNFFNKKTMDSFLFKPLINGQQLKIDINKDAYKDMLYIDDFLNAIFLLIKNRNKCSGETFLIGSGKKITIGEIIDLLKTNFPSSNIKYEPVKSLDEESFVFNISKIKNFIDWKPKISINKGFSILSNKLKKH